MPEQQPGPGQKPELGQGPEPEPYQSFEPDLGVDITHLAWPDFAYYFAHWQKQRNPGQAQVLALEYYSN